jgi:UPF0755 protein
MRKVFNIFLITIFLFGIYAYYIIFAPIKYNTENINPKINFEVSQGESIRKVSQRLQDENYIKSALWFRILMSIYDTDKHYSYGIYEIYKKDLNPGKNLIDIVKIFANKKAVSPNISITIPEGFTTGEIADRVAKNFSTSENRKEYRDNFYNYAKNYNGKLFPETYFFSKNESIENIVKKMTDQFEKKVGNFSQDDLVLASIIEGEGKGVQDMKMISGILKERMRIGMALQVDVATSTYKTIDLPKEAINNPGLNAIDAVRSSTKTDFMYYITGNDGNFYYAKTFPEHKKNIQKYLK